ncbi:MAG: hypothetical protein ACE5F1_10950, partial [Planctomycetota bacterium]
MNRRVNPEGGNALVFVLILTMVMGYLASTFLLEGIAEVRSTTTNRIEMALLEEAENALHYNYTLLELDPLYAVKDTLGFAANGADSIYDGQEQDFSAGSGSKAKIKLSIQYLNGTAPVMFANRANPKDAFNQILVFSTAKKAWAERQVVASYQYQMSEKFGGAIVSDMVPTGVTGLSAKSQSQTGDIVLTGNGVNGQQYMFGNMKANGAIRYYQDKSTETAVLTAANAGSYLGSFSGGIQQGLGGTPEQIPDFTALGGADQLFDFDRFQAAANAGAGTVFTSIASFASAMNTANGLGEPLEGIIVLDLDSGAEGSKPKIIPTVPSKPGEVQVAGGINIRGTLLFRFNSGTASDYKVFITTALNLNAGDISGLNPADESTYATAYPPNFVDTSKAPWNVDITPGFENFDASSDLPALMFNTGIVDIHGSANVCGVVYGPS